MRNETSIDSGGTTRRYYRFFSITPIIEKKNGCSDEMSSSEVERVRRISESDEDNDRVWILETFMNDTMDRSVGTFWMIQKVDGRNTNTCFYVVESHTKSGAPRLRGIGATKISGDDRRTNVRGSWTWKPDPTLESDELLPTRRTKDGFYRAKREDVWKCDPDLGYSDRWDCDH